MRTDGWEKIFRRKRSIAGIRQKRRFAHNCMQVITHIRTELSFCIHVFTASLPALPAHPALPALPAPACPGCRYATSQTALGFRGRKCMGAGQTQAMRKRQEKILPGLIRPGSMPPDGYRSPISDMHPCAFRTRIRCVRGEAPYSDYPCFRTT